MNVSVVEEELHVCCELDVAQVAGIFQAVFRLLVTGQLVRGGANNMANVARITCDSFLGSFPLAAPIFILLIIVVGLLKFDVKGARGRSLDRDQHVFPQQDPFPFPALKVYAVLGLQLGGHVVRVTLDVLSQPQSQI